jgi:hypothetical protein
MTGSVIVDMSVLAYPAIPMFASKPIVWLRADIKTPPFSHQARLEAGFLLRRLTRWRTARDACLSSAA